MKKIVILLIIISSCKAKKVYTPFFISKDCQSTSLFKIPVSIKEKIKSIDYTTSDMMQNYNEIINEHELSRSNIFDIKSEGNNCLNIIVDTIANVYLDNNKYNLRKYGPIDYNTASKDTTKLNGLLVYIYNPMMKDAFINVTLNNVYAILEAKNENDVWKPIEFANLGDWCTVQTNRSLLIKSKKYLKFKTIKYKGNFKTEMRLKLKDFNNIYYSNIFIGTLNKSQFDMSSFLPKYEKGKENLYLKTIFLDD